MKLVSIKKIENDSDLYDIQTGTQNFFANGVLVHNSMIHTVHTEQGIRLKSKKAFNSEVALAAEKWMHNQPGQRVLSFVNFVAAHNSTAIFEWTAPDARIVLFYPVAELRLLHVRHNETGDYLDGEVIKTWANKFGVSVVDEVDEFFDFQPTSPGKLTQSGVMQMRAFNIKRMMEAAKSREGIEGWVIQFEDGDMVKVKTDWYLKRHHAMTFIRERDIAQLVLDEGLDDIKSLLVSENVDISEILQIEDRVLHDLRELALSVDLAYEENKHLDRKDFAIKNKGHAYFGLLMAKYLGKDPDIKGYFERNILKDNYSLRQLGLKQFILEDK